MKSEKIFRYILLASAYLLLVIVCGFFITAIYNSYPAFFKFGLKFISGTTWDPVTNEFGALPFIIGTLLTSFISLIISFPISLIIALFLGEYFKTGILNSIIKTSVELLAGIPSIVYGFWGLFVFVPFFRDIELKLNILPYGVGILSSSIVLAIMIIPYSSSIIREVITMVPKDIKEAGYSLGATRYEIVKKIILPHSMSGIFAGILLSLGRALGETMAVTMVIGNSNMLPSSIFAPANTMASVIANEFTEATGNVYLSSLIGIGLLLFIITTIINIVGKYTLKKISVYMGV
jgi:phosphate transport system permease protein